MKIALKITAFLIMAVLLSHCSQRQDTGRAEVKDISEQPRITGRTEAPPVVNSLLEKADIAIQNGDNTTAINHLQRALQISPATAEIQQQLAEVYLADGRYQQAGYWAEVVVNNGPKTDPLCSQSRQTLALAAEALGQLTKQAHALAALKDCLPNDNYCPIHQQR